MSNSLILKISKGILPLLIFFNTYGQVNLVPNPSFESYTICPKIVGTPAPPPNLWSAIPIKGIQFLNTCANTTAPQFGVPRNDMGSFNNYQPSHTGNSYCDLVILNTSALAGNYGGKRHYLQAKLNDSLRKGIIYSCGFYVALSNGANYGCNNIAMCISKNNLTVDTAVVKSWVINAAPQIYNYGNPIIKDTQNWTLIQAVFIAQGGEQYVTIGNFKDNANTSIDRYLPPDVYDWAVYAFDDVFVYEVNNSYCATASAGRDTAIHTGDSVFIGSYTNGIDSIKWLQNGNVAIDSTRPGFWVKPLVNTFYVLQQTVNGCFSADTVVVTVNSLPLTMLGFSAIYQPTPSPSREGSVLLQWQTANEINVSYFNILKSSDGVNFKVIGKAKAQNKSYNEYSFIDAQFPSLEGLGVGYYKIESVDNDGRKQYSETKTLNFKPQTLKGVSIYPNPAKDFVTVECKGAKELLIIDYLGRTIKQFNNPTQPQPINCKQLSKGLYVVKVITNNGDIKTEKLIVEWYK